MVRAILVAIAIYFVLKLLRGRHLAPKQKRDLRIDDVLETDPVSGVRVPRKQALTEVIDGKTYYFCSEDTKKEFLQKRSA